MIPETEYSKLKAEIKALEEKAELMRQKEIDGIIAAIKSSISDYKISASDLGFCDQPSVTQPQVEVNPGKQKKKAEPKYQSPNGLNKWAGRGLTPTWLTEYLNADSCHKKEDLLIKKDAITPQNNTQEVFTNLEVTPKLV